MFEIELKAHVADRAAVIEALNGLARYLGAVQKEDCYYGRQGGRKCRIRKETPFCAEGQPLPAEQADSKGGPGQARVYFTYKRKELRTDGSGAALEVNDEKECLLSDAAALEAFLADNGFTLVLSKSKTVLGWLYQDIHAELCRVPPLGDFLELETFSADRSQEAVAKARKALLALLEKTGIGQEQIEERYYSELLREAEKGENADV